MTLDRPRPEEIEITVFGPGYGESIALHLGWGQWIIIDSCLGVWSRTDPAPVWYLKHLGVDLAAEVRLVCITHWHDDHIRGVAKVVAQSSSAKVVVPAAFRHDDFMTLVEQYRVAPVAGFGVKEFRGVLDAVELSGRRLGIACQNRELLAVREGGETRRLWALSPSDESINRALALIGEMVPKLGHSPVGVTKRGPNYSSVVTLVEAPGTCALLGGDLEVHGDEAIGWKAVLNESTSFVDRASYIKVPHHGSPTGHCDELWRDKLTLNPVACVTPFKAGRVMLPGPGDIIRICGLTSNAYVTGPSRNKRAASSITAFLEKTLAIKGLALYEAPECTGLVRGRYTPGVSSDWTVECYSEARKLTAS